MRRIGSLAMMMLIPWIVGSSYAQPADVPTLAREQILIVPVALQASPGIAPPPPARKKTSGRMLPSKTGRIRA